MDFFTDHGWLFLLGLTFFPRLTLLFSSVVSGGLFWWLGWLLTPHLLVAVLAIPYWDTNPFLVSISWVIALDGTITEVKAVNNHTNS